MSLYTVQRVLQEPQLLYAITIPTFTTQERKLGSFTGSEGSQCQLSLVGYDSKASSRKYILPARCLILPAWVACLLLCL